VARIIAEAGVRLVADSKGFGASIRSSIRAALKEASVEADRTDVFQGVEKDAERTATRTRSIFGNLFSSLTRGASTLGSVLAGATKFALVGAAAGAAGAGLSSLLGVLIPVIGAMAQASGVAALLPAALLGIVAVTTTLKLGLVGVGDAFKALASGDVTKFNEALKGLAPAAQDFVRSAAKVKPEFDKMQLDVQERLFAGLGEQVGRLAELYLPKARQLFGGLATTINGAGKSVGLFLQSGTALSGVSKLVENINAAFRALLAPVAQMAQAFLDLSVVGSGFFPALAEGVGQAAQKFSQFISTAAQTGQLQEFFSGARSSETSPWVSSACSPSATRLAEDSSEPFSRWWRSSAPSPNRWPDRMHCARSLSRARPQFRTSSRSSRPWPRPSVRASRRSSRT
jgi:hypothetical protein